MRPFRSPGLVVPLVLAGCSLPQQEDMDLAQTTYETVEAVQEMQEAQLELNARIDSLVQVVRTQDSLIRMIANLSGNPLPPRP